MIDKKIRLCVFPMITVSIDDCSTIFCHCLRSNSELCFFYLLVFQDKTWSVVFVIGIELRSCGVELLSCPEY